MMAEDRTNTGQSHPRCHGEDGFTLIEIVLVIVIMSVTAMMIAPSFFSATGSSLPQETRRLAQASRLALDEAALSGHPIRWSARAHGYSFEAPDGGGVWRQLKEQPYRSYNLPGGIRIMAVRPTDALPVEGRHADQAGEAVMARLTLLPQGISDPAAIVVAEKGDGDGQMTIQLHPGPGSVSISKGNGE